MLADPIWLTLEGLFVGKEPVVLVVMKMLVTPPEAL
jgi:hypothetical protein